MSFKKERHSFEAPEGSRLCTWCGNLRLSHLHFTNPPKWDPIEYAPKGQEIKVIMPNGEKLIAHFAQDLSGECQPPFKGWFVARQNKAGQTIGYTEIETPLGWRSIKKQESK